MNSDLVQSFVKEVVNTEVYNKVRELYPELELFKFMDGSYNLYEIKEAISVDIANNKKSPFKGTDIETIIESIISEEAKNQFSEEQSMDMLYDLYEEL
jgi:hypothetical protein